MNIQAYKAVIWSQLTRSTDDFPVNSIWVLDICQINSWEIQQRTNIQTIMKVQVADSWQTHLWRRFQRNLQSMATYTQQLHIYCRLLQEIDYCLFLTDDPGDFADKEIFYIVDCHDVTLLLKSEAGFKLRFIRFWFILWFRVDISWVRLLFHLLTSLLAAAMAMKRWKFWKWLTSKQLLQSIDHKYRRRESSTVLASSGLRSCWKNAVSSKVLDPSSFRRSSCTNSRLSTSTRGRSCRHPLPVARKTAFNLENWSSSAEKQQDGFVVSDDLDWENDLRPTVLLIIIIITQALTLICYDFIITYHNIRLATVSKAEIHF